MRRFTGASGASPLSWLAVVSFGGMALAGAVAPAAPSLALSPERAVAGVTLDADEPFEMTLHLRAQPRTTYALEVSYAGDAVGTCAAAAAPLTTNPRGKASWACAFDTAANTSTTPLSGTVTFTVADVGSLEAKIAVRAADTDADETTEVEERETVAAAGENHGHCVSYWARASKTQGLRGKARGAFISSIAADPAAVAPKGAPGPACDFQDELDTALDQQAAQPAKPAKQRRTTPVKKAKPTR